MFETPKRSVQKTLAEFDVLLTSVYQMLKALQLQMHYPNML
jgi:hypothetical protein